VVLALVTPLWLACREPSSEETGAVLYARHCAPCHGDVGRRDAATEPPPDAPDLTRLGARFGTPLQRDELASFIDGRREVKAHGTRDMPAWGVRLYEGYPETSGTETVREGTIEMLLDYLESVQRP
jgi:mono/diheme cytochrome c family protein